MVDGMEREREMWKIGFDWRRKEGYIDEDIRGLYFKGEVYFRDLSFLDLGIVSV